MHLKFQSDTVQKGKIYSSSFRSKMLVNCILLKFQKELTYSIPFKEENLYGSSFRSQNLYTLYGSSTKWS